MQDEEVTFNVFEAMKYPSNYDECHYIDIIDKVTIEVFESETQHYHLRHALFIQQPSMRMFLKEESVRTT